MKLMMTVLTNEKSRLEKALQTATDNEKTDLKKQLDIVNSDIDRMEMYIDRPSMQTWSELLFVDDIRQRVELIQERNN